MTTVALDDAIAARRRVGRDRVPYRPKPGATAGGRDPFVERRLGVLQQPPNLVIDLPDRIGPRRVTVKAVDDCADIDGDDVAFPQSPLARDTVDDLVVDRGTDIAGKSMVAVEVGLGSQLRDGIPHQR